MRKLILLLSMSLLSIVMMGQDMSSYSGSWNTPTICHAASGYKYAYFGMVAPCDRNPTMTTHSLPAIPGLKYRSCYAYCPVDTCFAQRAIKAIRCPNESNLLRWVSTRAEWFYLLCDYDFYPVYEGKGRYFDTTSQLLNFYMNKLEKSFKNIDCRHFSQEPNNQNAILIVDCWRTKRYCTFYEASWVDCISNGNTVRESYFSVDVKTGKAADIRDLVDEKYLPKLAEVMLSYLKNDCGDYWKDYEERNKEKRPLDILLAMDGCALIREGLVVYFHPYTIGSGVEGEYFAIIPINIAGQYLKQM